MSRRHTTELEPQGYYPPYTPPTARKLPKSVKYGGVLLVGALAATAFTHLTRGPSGTEPPAHPDLVIAPAVNSAQQPVQPKPSPHAAPPQRASKRLSVNARMASDGSINELDVRTKPLKVDLQLRSCSAQAIRKVENLADNPSSRAMVWLLNASMDTSGGVIKKPGKYGIDCKSISLLLPSEVTIDAPRTEALATLLTGDDTAAEDLLVFNRTKASFATYQNQINIPKFDFRFPTIDGPRDLLDLGYERYVEVTDDRTMVTLEFDKFVAPKSS